MRSLRVLLAANDGFSAGHVARMVAIAGAMHRVAKGRSVDVECLLVTTSEATSLYADAALAVVRLPSPSNAQRAGISDAERRRLARALVDAAAESFAPDLVVIDTFPRGPHGELEGLHRIPAKRALVRRDVRADRTNDDLLQLGLDRFDLLVLADDPGSIDAPKGGKLRVRVPPITMEEPERALPRESARRELGMDDERRAVLVVAGGGGDAQGNETARVIARTVATLSPEACVVIAQGPLARRIERGSVSGIHSVSVAPVSRYLAAFDFAFSAAGYNSAHELAKAGLPFALFAEPRPFDDQQARAQRFERAGLSCFLERTDSAAVSKALAWQRPKKATALALGGADRAAEHLLGLVTGEGA